MRNRQAFIFLAIGLVVGILLGVIGSSDSLFGTASNEGSNNAANIEDADGSRNAANVEDAEGSGSAANVEDAAGSGNAANVEDAEGSGNAANVEDAAGSGNAANVEDAEGSGNAANTEDAAGSGNAANTEDTTDGGNAANIVDASDAFMVTMESVEPMLGDMAPARVEDFNDALGVVASFTGTPEDTAAVITAVEEGVLPTMYEVLVGAEAANMAEGPADDGPVVCFGFKSDPSDPDAKAVPYLYLSVPASLSQSPVFAQLTDFQVGQSPSALIYFQLLACYPKP